MEGWLETSLEWEDSKPSLIWRDFGSVENILGLGERAALCWTKGSVLCFMDS